MYVHELGHILISLYYNKFVRLDGDMLLETVFNSDNKEYDFEILLYGIFTGYCVIIVYGYYCISEHNDYLMFIIASIVYFIGCYYDVLKILNIFKK
jgi:uncharacterized membrane protein YesL